MNNNNKIHNKDTHIKLLQRLVQSGLLSEFIIAIIVNQKPKRYNLIIRSMRGLKIMKFNQVKEFFKDMKDKNLCPLTNRLIMSGYQQTDGYINDAKEGKNFVNPCTKIEVNYLIAEPNQWWHLMNYCTNKIDNEHKGSTDFRPVSCGELIFWMAEVSNAVDNVTLKEIIEEIKQYGTPKNRRKKELPNIEYQRSKCNKIIKDICWDKIVEKVESKYKK